MTSREADTQNRVKRRAPTGSYILPKELKRKIDALIEDIERASRRLDEAQRRIARQRIARY